MSNIEKFLAAEDPTHIAYYKEQMENDTKVEELDYNEELAEIAYTAYSDAVGGVNFQGDPLPTWKVFSVDQTKAKQVNAWRAVIHALTHIKM